MSAQQKTIRRVLVTGATGRLGSIIVPALLDAGYLVRMTDIRAPAAIPDGAAYVRADLCDGVAMMRAAEGCQAVVHLGGTSGDPDAPDALLSITRGTFNVSEAAAHANARLILASTCHVVGLLPLDARPSVAAPLAPDGHYGAAKAYAEMLAALHWRRHGLPAVVLRIGLCGVDPVVERHLSMWLSPGDFGRLVLASLGASRLGHATIWAASHSSTPFYGVDDRELIGWAPEDSAEPWRERLAGVHHRAALGPVANTTIGGPYCARLRAAGLIG
ncbi:NAD(P)-dependent oxidoreductase [Falsiroseomonas sp.]|uniref:NAD-dependent epimerase/dehydratase family protein n=1 Tax=Falsiroseomonas sp. TaxID=2870721 RepID=UPI00271FB1F6|nr:NAD(P)-dependent oxidoreductase [Falsiroseomonas sp.]MDO9499921.1 NAD(P)-dependent oxidoreductase [Falsiroseomonas sp.]